MTNTKVTLISVDEYGPSIGIRFLSSVLKKAGFQTNVLFIRGMVTKDAAFEKAMLFDGEMHDIIADLCEKSLYIGISVATSTYHKAREITERLKSRMSIPIIWGGVHTIIKPEECLQYADMLCAGEGENLAVELARRLQKGDPLSGIPGLVLPGEPGIPPVLPEITDLPDPDYSFDGTHYLAMAGRKLIPFDISMYNQAMFNNYYLSPTRGCPHKCTYCINNKYFNLYRNSGGKRFRSRNLDNLIAELKNVKKNIRAVRRIIIDDDCFMALKTEDVRYFAEEYQKHIGLPFVIRGAHPNNLTEEKLDILCKAGLIKLRVGVQTGSENIRKLYARTWENNKKILAMAHMINRFIKEKKLRYVMYDFIVDNPWETEQDKLDTLNLILTLPRPFGLYNFSLTFYPGTALAEKAITENIAEDDPKSETYWKQYWNLAPTPVNTVLDIMCSMPLPSSLMRFLARDSIVAAGIRNFLKILVAVIPEVSLFQGTKLRYEADSLLMFGEESREIAVKRLKEEQENVEPKVLMLLRRFLLEIYIKHVSPPRMNLD